MNDEFMGQLRETPAADFEYALYERISRKPAPGFATILHHRLTLRNALVALALLLFVAACVYAVTEKRWNKVGVIYVAVQRTIKVDNPSLSGEPLVMEFQPECLSIEEARETLRFSFRIPAWAPDEFTFSKEVCGFEDLSASSDQAFLDWEGADKSTPLILDLRNLEQFNIATQKYEVSSASIAMFGMAVVPGSYEEVQVHGQPAVLVRGDWNWDEAPWATGETSVKKYEYNWDEKRALQLYWVDGKVFYRLYTRANVSPEELIKMAESAQ